MKKLLIGLALVLVLIVAAVVAAPFFIPTATYAARIEAAVKDATGRELTINGPISLSLIPRLAIEASDVTFANPPGASRKTMATLSKLQLRLNPLALLSRQVAVDSFVLVEPKIDLEIAKDGRPNWIFANPAAGGAQGAPASGAAPAAAGGGKPAGSSGFGITDIRLGDIRLVDGTITYADARSGARQQLDAINAKLVLPDLDSAMKLTGSARWNAKTVDLSLDLGALRGFLAGAATAAAVSVSAPAVKFDFKGKMTHAAAFALDGDTALDIASLRELAAWTGVALPATNSGLGPLRIAGKLDLSGAKASFTGAEIALDAMKGKGDLVVDTGGARPYLKGDLAIDRLDLNPYLPPEPAAATGKPGAASGAAHPAGPPPGADAATAAGEGWSDKPVDLAALRGADADFALALGALQMKKIEIGKSALDLHLKDGKLAADLTQMVLYGGDGKASIRLDAAAAVPALTVSLDLAKVEAEKLLKDAMDLDRVKGNANGEIAVTTHGRSEREMIGALAGKGSLRLLDGAVRGIDLGALLRNPAGAILDPAARRNEETAFSHLSGTFTIASGILKNEDLALASPALQVAGAGTIDLPQRRLDYRVEPKLGAGGGLSVPVVIAGPWDHLSYRPQLDSVLKQPDKALESLKGILGGSRSGTPAPGDGAPAAPTKPADILRGLFGAPRK